MDPSPVPSWRSALLDWGPVVLVAALGTTGFGLEQPWSGSDLELALSGLATALPLGWRRTRPVVVAVVVGLVIVAQSHVLGESLGFAAFCAFLIAGFSIARHVTRLDAALTATGLLFGATMVAQADAIAERPVDLVFPLVYGGATFLAGRGMRHWADQAERLHGLTVALEAEQDSRARLAITEERLHWSRELHDVVGHTVTMMVVQAAAAEENLQRDPAAAEGSLRAIQEAGRSGLAQLRQLVEVLREEPGASPSDLADDLDLVVAGSRASGLEVRLVTEGDLSGLPAPVTTTVTRLAQEALTNVLRHSRAGTARISVVATTENVTVEVSDPGPAGATAFAGGGRGLTGLSERVRLLGGELVTGPDGDGFAVRATLPRGPGR